MARTFEKLAAMNAAGKHLCVGLDPSLKHIGRVFGLTTHHRAGKNRARYAKDIVRATSAFAACYKINFWFWFDVLNQLQEVIQFIEHEVPNAVIILDLKIGDIEHTLENLVMVVKNLGIDVVTVNPYMGIADVTSPFLNEGINCFILGRTSNHEADELQELEITTSRSPRSRPSTLAHIVAQSVNNSVREGLSLGLVVGTISAYGLQRMRVHAPNTPFLIAGLSTRNGDLHNVVQHMRRHMAPWIVNVGRGIVEATNEPDKWLPTMAETALSYHKEMVPAV